MTRFKKLQRIETSIEHKNSAELQWAIGCCRMRLQLAQRKAHRKYWLGIEKSVHTALAEVKDYSS